MIYADHAATTEVSERALAAAMPFFRAGYGNASSSYGFGRAARRAVEKARTEVADAIGAQAGEITFSSGGTEGNNAVLRGVVQKAVLSGRRPHIIVSAFEHPSVLMTCKALAQQGVKISYLPVDHAGRVMISALKEMLTADTVLVSCMLANNEVGTVQDVGKLAQVLEGTGIPLHTDAVQAVGHISVDVDELGCMYLTASGHKFHALKGTGFYYQRTGHELPAVITGGVQEGGRRAGTENTAGIVALAAALAESIEMCEEEGERLSRLVQFTAEGVKGLLPDVRVNGEGGQHLPGTLNLGIGGVRGESLVHLLDLKGICVSTASACSAGEDVPSHVLLAMGQSREQAMEALRISYGRQNTEADAEQIVQAIGWAVWKIRGEQGYCHP